MDKKQYQKEYRLKNKEKLRIYRKEYWEKNKDKLKIENRIRGKKWYQENKERRLKKAKEWAQKPENRKKMVKYVQKYVRKNKEKVADYNKKFNQTLEGKYRLIKFRHIERWNDQVMTIKEFTKIIEKPCKYCGENSRYGIDRIDNEKGYTKENSVSCCKLCNFMKKALTQKDFLNHIKKIYEWNEKSK